MINFVIIHIFFLSLSTRTNINHQLFPFGVSISLDNNYGQVGCCLHFDLSFDPLPSQITHNIVHTQKLKDIFFAFAEFLTTTEDLYCDIIK